MTATDPSGTRVVAGGGTPPATAPGSGAAWAAALLEGPHPRCRQRRPVTTAADEATAPAGGHGERRVSPARTPGHEVTPAGTAGLRVLGGGQHC